MKKFILVFLVMYSIACTSNKSKPAAAIPFDSMKVIIWDLFKADAYINKYISKDSVKKTKQESIELYEKIFRLHKVDKQAFYKSCAYYLSNPDKHKILLDSIIAMANKSKDALHKDTSIFRKDTVMHRKNRESFSLKNSVVNKIEKEHKDTPTSKKHKQKALHKKNIK